MKSPWAPPTTPDGLDQDSPTNDNGNSADHPSPYIGPNSPTPSDTPTAESPPAGNDPTNSKSSLGENYDRVLNENPKEPPHNLSEYEGGTHVETGDAPRPTDVSTSTDPTPHTTSSEFSEPGESNRDNSSDTRGPNDDPNFTAPDRGHDDGEGRSPHDHESQDNNDRDLYREDQDDRGDRGGRDHGDGDRADPPAQQSPESGHPPHGQPHNQQENQGPLDEQDHDPDDLFAPEPDRPQTPAPTGFLPHGTFGPFASHGLTTAFPTPPKDLFGLPISGKPDPYSAIPTQYPDALDPSHHDQFLDDFTRRYFGTPNEPIQFNNTITAYPFQRSNAIRGLLGREPFRDLTDEYNYLVDYLTSNPSPDNDRHLERLRGIGPPIPTSPVSLSDPVWSELYGGPVGLAPQSPPAEDTDASPSTTEPVDHPETSARDGHTTSSDEQRVVPDAPPDAPQLATQFDEPLNPHEPTTSPEPERTSDNDGHTHQSRRTNPDDQPTHQHDQQESQGQVNEQDQDPDDLFMLDPGHSPTPAPTGFLPHGTFDPFASHGLTTALPTPPKSPFGLPISGKPDPNSPATQYPDTLDPTQHEKYLNDFTRRYFGTPDQPIQFNNTITAFPLQRSNAIRRRPHERYAANPTTTESSENATTSRSNPAPEAAPHTVDQPTTQPPPTRHGGPRTFRNDHDVDEFSQHWNGYPETLTNDQRAAITRYSGSRDFPTYRHINHYLRSGYDYHPAIGNDIARIDEALAGSPLPENIEVLRGMDLSHIDVPPEQMPNQLGGFTDPAYQSTSLYRLPGSARFKESILHLTIPRGTPALWIEGLAENRNTERELLLGRGLTYNVHHTEFRNGQWHIHAGIRPSVPATTSPATHNPTHAPPDNDPHGPPRTGFPPRGHTGNHPPGPSSSTGFSAFTGYTSPPYSGYTARPNHSQQDSPTHTGPEQSPDHTDPSGTDQPAPVPRTVGNEADQRRRQESQGQVNEQDQDPGDLVTLDPGHSPTPAPAGFLPHGAFGPFASNGLTTAFPAPPKDPFGLPISGKPDPYTPGIAKPTQYPGVLDLSHDHAFLGNFTRRYFGTPDEPFQFNETITAYPLFGIQWHSRNRSTNPPTPTNQPPPPDTTNNTTNSHDIPLQNIPHQPITDEPDNTSDPTEHATSDDATWVYNPDDYVITNPYNPDEYRPSQQSNTGNETETTNPTSTAEGGTSPQATQPQSTATPDAPDSHGDEGTRTTTEGPTDQSDQRYENVPIYLGPAPVTQHSDDPDSDTHTRERMRQNESSIFSNARVFPDAESARQWAEENWGEVINNLPNSARDSLTDYARDNYNDINYSLRYGGAQDEITQQVRDIDQAMHPVPEDIVVTRGTDLDYLGDPSTLHERTDGIRENGYFSTMLGDVTSSGSMFKNMDGIIHLRVPAGTPAVWVKHNPSERELLLGRGFSYRVHDTVQYQGKWHIYAEITTPTRGPATNQHGESNNRPSRVGAHGDTPPALGPSQVQSQNSAAAHPTRTRRTPLPVIPEEDEPSAATPGPAPTNTANATVWAERQRPTQEYADQIRAEGQRLNDTARSLNEDANHARGVADELHDNIGAARLAADLKETDAKIARGRATTADNRARRLAEAAERASDPAVAPPAAHASFGMVSGPATTRHQPHDHTGGPRSEAEARERAERDDNAARDLEGRATMLDDFVREADPSNTNHELIARATATAQQRHDEAAEMRRQATVNRAIAERIGAQEAAGVARDEATDLGERAEALEHQVSQMRNAIDTKQESANRAESIVETARAEADRASAEATAAKASTDRIQENVPPEHANLGSFITSDWYRRNASNVANALGPHIDTMLTNVGIDNPDARRRARVNLQQQAEQNIESLFTTDGYQTPVPGNETLEVTLRADPNQTYHRVTPLTFPGTGRAPSSHRPNAPSESLEIVARPFYMGSPTDDAGATPREGSGQLHISAGPQPTADRAATSSDNTSTLDLSGNNETYRASLPVFMTASRPDGTGASSMPGHLDVTLTAPGGFGFTNSPDQIALDDPYLRQQRLGRDADAIGDSHPVSVGAITNTNGVSLSDAIQGLLFGSYLSRLRGHDESGQGPPRPNTLMKKAVRDNYRANQETFSGLDDGSIVKNNLPAMTSGVHTLNLVDFKGQNRHVPIASASTNLRKLPNPPRFSAEDERTGANTATHGAGRGHPGDNNEIIAPDGTRIPREDVDHMLRPHRAGDTHDGTDPPMYWGAPGTDLYEITRNFHVWAPGEPTSRVFTGTTYELLRSEDAHRIASSMNAPTSGTPQPGGSDDFGKRRPTEEQADRAQRHARDLRAHADHLTGKPTGSRGPDQAGKADRDATAAENKAAEMRRNALPEHADLGSLLQSRFYGSQPINIDALSSHIEAQLDNAGLDNRDDPVRGAIRSDLLRQASDDMRPFFSPTGYQSQVRRPGGEPDDIFTLTFRVDPKQVFQRVPRTTSGPLQQHSAPHRLAQTEGTPNVNTSYTGARGGAKSLTVGVLFTPFYIAPIIDETFSEPPNIGVRAQVKFSMGFRVRSHGFGASTSGGDSSIIELKGPTEPYQANLPTRLTITRPDGAARSATSGELDVTLQVPNGPSRANDEAPDTITLADPHEGHEVPGPGASTADQSHPYATGPSTNQHGVSMADDIRAHLLATRRNKLRKNPPEPATAERTNPYNAPPKDHIHKNGPTLDALENGGYMMDNQTKMTNEWHDVKIVDGRGHSQAIAVTSTPVSYTKMPFMPAVFDFSSLTDATAGITETTGIKSFLSAMASVGPDVTISNMIRTTFGMLEAKAQQDLRGTGDTRSHNGSLTSMFWGAPDTDLYEVQRVDRARFPGEHEPRTYTRTTYEVLTSEDARQIKSAESTPPAPRPATQPQPTPFDYLDRDRVTNFHNTKAKAITFPGGNSYYTPSTRQDGNQPAAGTGHNRSLNQDQTLDPDIGTLFTDALAQNLIREVAQQFPGMVVPDRSHTRDDFARRPRHDWAMPSPREHRPFRRNYETAVENTQRIRDAVSKANMKGHLHELTHDGIAVELKESALIDPTDGFVRPDIIVLRLFADVGAAQYAGDSDRSVGEVATSTDQRGNQTGSGNSQYVGAKMVNSLFGIEPSGPRESGLVNLLSGGVSRTFARNKGQGQQVSSISSVMFGGKSHLWHHDITFKARIDTFRQEHATRHIEADDSGRVSGSENVRTWGTDLKVNVHGRLELATPQVTLPRNVSTIHLVPPPTPGSDRDTPYRTFSGDEAKNLLNGQDPDGSHARRANAHDRLSGTIVSEFNTGANDRNEPSVVDYQRANLTKPGRRRDHLGVRDSDRRKIDKSASRNEAGHRYPENLLSRQNLAAHALHGVANRRELSGGFWSPNTIRVREYTGAEVESVTLTPFEGSVIDEEAATSELNSGTAVTKSWTLSDSPLMLGNLNDPTNPSAPRGSEGYPTYFSGPAATHSRVYSSTGESRTIGATLRTSFFLKGNTFYQVRASGLIQQAAEIKRVQEFPFTIYRSPTYEGWERRYDNLFTGYMPAMDAFTNGLVHDQLDENGELTTRDTPKPTEPVQIRPGFEETGTTIGPIDPSAILAELDRQVADENPNGRQELTKDTRTTLYGELSGNLAKYGNTNAAVPVELTNLDGANPTSSPATANVKITRTNERVVHMGSTEYREALTELATNTRSFGKGSTSSAGWGGYGMMTPVGGPGNPDQHIPSNEQGNPSAVKAIAPTNDTTASKTDGTKTTTSQTSSRTFQFITLSPYARVAADTEVTVELTFPDPEGHQNRPESTITVNASGGTEHKRYPTSYLEFGSPREGDTTPTANARGDRPSRVAPVPARSATDALLDWDKPGSALLHDGTLIFPETFGSEGKDMRDTVYASVAMARKGPPSESTDNAPLSPGAVDDARRYLTKDLNLNPRSNIIERQFTPDKLRSHILSAFNPSGTEFDPLGKTDWRMKATPDYRDARILHVNPVGTINDSRLAPTTSLNVSDTHGTNLSSSAGVAPIVKSEDSGDHYAEQFDAVDPARVGDHSGSDSRTMAPKPTEAGSPTREGPFFLVEFDINVAVAAQHDNGPVVVGESTDRMTGWVSQDDATRLGIIPAGRTDTAAPAIAELARSNQRFQDAQAAYEEARRNVHAPAHDAEGHSPGSPEFTRYSELNDRVAEAEREHVAAQNNVFDAQAAALAAVRGTAPPQADGSPNNDNDDGTDHQHDSPNAGFRNLPPEPTFPPDVGLINYGTVEAPDFKGKNPAPAGVRAEPAGQPPAPQPQSPPTHRNDHDADHHGGSSGSSSSSPNRGQHDPTNASPQPPATPTDQPSVVSTGNTHDTPPKTHEANDGRNSATPPRSNLSQQFDNALNPKPEPPTPPRRPGSGTRSPGEQRADSGADPHAEPERSQEPIQPPDPENPQDNEAPDQPPPSSSGDGVAGHGPSSASDTTQQKT